MSQVSVQELEWAEQSLGEVLFLKERLQLSAGFGSGLATRAGGATGEVWAISDRGPNIKLEDARVWYGWEAPAEWRDMHGAKLMPRPDIGPALALLQVTDSSIELKRTLRLRDREGRLVTGLPVPESGHAECEPVLDLQGRHLRPDSSGMDTEGLAVLEDGTFWAGEEYGPSLVRIGADGVVLERLVPEGVELPGAPCPVRAALPALAAKRHLNRGFEAVAVSPSNRLLYLAFQSPLAHPTHAEHEQARHVRVWQLDAEGNPLSQFLYRFDEPATFCRDSDDGPVEPSDRKVCEITAIGEHLLLTLERASKTSKIYRVSIDPALALSPKHWRPETTPTVEQLSSSDEPLPELRKELMFTSDDWPQVGADIEGMALLDPRTLLIVSDNDFGCEGKQTRFYRLTFDADLAAV
jgi:hypothetical protein